MGEKTTDALALLDAAFEGDVAYGEAVAEAHIKVAARRRRLDLLSAHIHLTHTIADHVRHAIGKVRRIRIIGVYDTHAQAARVVSGELEEAHLGVAISLKCLMIVQVLVGQGRHDGHTVWDTPDAVLSQSVARCLQYQPFDPFTA